MEKSRKHKFGEPETTSSPSQSKDGGGGGHISLASSPTQSSHSSSGELKQHPSPTTTTLQARLYQEQEDDSPPRSSISSLSHVSSPTPSPSPFPIARQDNLLPPVATVVSRSVRDEPPPALSKTMDHGIGGGGRVEEEGGRRRMSSRPSLSILKKTERELMVKKAALGFRVFGFVFSLVSFSVFAADRNQGWALDSFDRYTEFRYCMSVNVIGFVYSGVQTLDLAYQLAKGKSIVLSHLRCYFTFAADQVVTYLLISASSSAATRIEDWKSNWGSDKFPDMATAAVSVSFLAFAALASSSIISGYALCTSKSI